MAEKEITMNFKICIQNLGKYNEGELLFHWLSLPATEEEIDRALSLIKICHKGVNGENIRFVDEFGSPYEELHIPDWECDVPEVVKYSEYASINYYNEIAKLLEELDKIDLDWLVAYIENTGSDLEYSMEHFRENSRFFPGMDPKEAAIEEFEECGYEVPDYLKGFIDWEKYAKENDFDSVSGGTINVFG